jgi:hypothetical protein
MPRFLAWIALPLYLAAAGCGDRTRLAQENERQKQEIRQLAAVQERSLAVQQRTLAELQAERDRSAQVQAEDRTLRSHAHLLSGAAILLGSALAVALAIVLFRSGRPSREAAP